MLNAAMNDGEIGLEPLGDQHVEGLREACAADQAIWEIYPICMIGEHFAPTLAALRGRDTWTMFAIVVGDRVAGMTSFIDRGKPGVIEIGGTYLAPQWRGTAVNPTMKQLMIRQAFAAGMTAVEFRVDTRNLRSQRAVEKLGARRAETLHGDLTTWTGYVRDAAVFRIERADWPA